MHKLQFINLEIKIQNSQSAKLYKAAEAHGVIPYIHTYIGRCNFDTHSLVHDARALILRVYNLYIQLLNIMHIRSCIFLTHYFDMKINEISDWKARAC